MQTFEHQTISDDQTIICNQVRPEKNANSNKVVKCFFEMNYFPNYVKS